MYRSLAGFLAMGLVIASTALGCGETGVQFGGGSAGETTSGTGKGGDGTGGTSGTTTTSTSSTTSSSTSTTSTSTSQSSTSSSSGSTSSSSSSGGPTCPPEAGDSSCIACAKTSCCPTKTACDNDPVCTCWVDCLAANNNDATKCGSCGPFGGAIQAYAVCSTQFCSAACSTSSSSSSSSSSTSSSSSSTSSSSSSTSSSSSSSSSSSGDPACAPVATDDPCTSCAKTNCCNLVSACAASQNCVCMVTCLQAGGSLIGCSGMCGIPGAAFINLGQCTNPPNGVCAASCN